MSDSGFVPLLKQTAARLRSRVVGVKLYDPNVGVSGVDWRDALESRKAKPDWFSHQTKVTTDGWNVTLRSNDRFVAVDLRGNFSSVTPFSVNRADRIVLTGEKPAGRIGTRRWPVFSQARVPTLLKQRHVEKAIEAFNLSDDESIHVYGNGVTVYVQPKSVQQLLAVVSKTTALVRKLPTDEEHPLDVSDLPAEFSTLMPLIRKWGVSDDVARAERLARASSVRLRALVMAVAPYFESVNAHLDTFRRRAMPASAAALGALAECASEAQLVLDDRDGRAVPTRRLQPTTARRPVRRGAPPRRLKRSR